MMYLIAWSTLSCKELRFAKEYLLTKPLKLQDSRHSMKSILNEYKAIVGRGTDPVVIDPHVANIVKGVSGKWCMSNIYKKTAVPKMKLFNKFLST